MSEPRGPATAEEAAWLAWRNDPRPLGWAIPVEERAFKDGYRAARADALAEIRAGVEGLMKDALRSYDDAVARSLAVLVDRPVEARLWSARMNGLDSVLALLDPPK